MPDIDNFEYLTNDAFEKGRDSFTERAEVRFYADDNNVTGTDRPIAISLPELSELIGGSQRYVEAFPSQNPWTVEHNLGVSPVTVTIYSGGVQVFANVAELAGSETTTIVITFATDVAGTVIVEG